VRARVRRGRPGAALDERIDAAQGVLAVVPLRVAVDLGRELAQRDLIPLLADPRVRFGADALVASVAAPPNGEWTDVVVALQTPDLTAALALEIGAGTGVTGAPFDVDELVIEEATLRRVARVVETGEGDSPRSRFFALHPPVGLPLLDSSEPTRPLV